MKLYLLAILLLCLSACTSPMKRIEPQIEEFKSKYPDHFQTYQSHGRSMRFAWSGSPENPPLLFIHGSPGGWSAWAEFLLNEKLQSRFHIISIDRPGYGGSGRGDSEISVTAQAAEIFDALQFNKSGKNAVVVGHSYGGAVVAEMVIREREKISTAIFVASSVDPEMEHEKWYQTVATWWPFRVLIPTDLRVCNEEILNLKSELEKQSGRWNQITARVATIQGSADPLVPPENQDFILKRIPATQIVYSSSVKGMNHFVPWEHPELILEAIENAK